MVSKYFMKIKEKKQTLQVEYENIRYEVNRFNDALKRFGRCTKTENLVDCSKQLTFQI